MIPIDQTKFAAITESDDPNVIGNCLQTCVASLLELPLEDVPHFAAQSDWYDAMCYWLADQGFAVVDQRHPIEGVLGICMGKSPRGNFTHVVITNGSDELAHDPHPSRAGLLTFDRWWYLLPTDPAR
ncbi:MAG: hypothetical protein PSX37_02990 [bacterium]|nr:hypothetical protein [bacterium]